MLMTITSGGIEALASALSSGTDVIVDRIELGDLSAAYTPTASQTALQGISVYKEDIQSHRVVDDNKVEFVQRLGPTIGDFDFREVALLLDDDTLFAIGVLSTAQQQAKTASTGTAAGNSITVVATIEYSNVATAVDLTISVSDTIPNATETVRGIIEIADNSEADAGTDDERAMTPAKVKRVIGDIPGVGNATKTVRGIIELATSSEVISGSDDVRAVTPAGLHAKSATTGRIGLIEQATNAETQAGTDTTRAVSPANLTSRTATETRTGIVELATQAETRTGTDSSRAVTPVNLQDKIDQIPDASDSERGLVELATNSESETGTDSSRAVTPAGLKSTLGAYIGPFSTRVRLRQSSSSDNSETLSNFYTFLQNTVLDGKTVGKAYPVSGMFGLAEVDSGVRSEGGVTFAEKGSSFVYLYSTSAGDTYSRWKFTSSDLTRDVLDLSGTTTGTDGWGSSDTLGHNTPGFSGVTSSTKIESFLIYPD